MYYNAEFKFLHSIFEKMRLQVLLLARDRLTPEPADLGLRNILGRTEEYRHVFNELPFKAAPNTIYKLTDQYLCNYLVLKLPEQKPAVLMIGPYMHMRLTSEQMMQEAERHGAPAYLLHRIEDCYNRIPVLHDDSFVLAAVNTFAELLWGGSEKYTVVDLTNELNVSEIYSSEEYASPPEQTLQSMLAMERRYACENELMKAVSQGLADKAESILAELALTASEQRVADPVRNLKNYCIIMNTLLRKAAENGGVHPIHLNSISSNFARKIESVGSLSSGQSLISDMLASYCRMVKSRTSAVYSAPVQKTISCINIDLTNDLTLSSLAKMQNISPGYLSALFKKEVGQTLTDYVTEKRILYAAELLCGTALQIQTVAQYCGILDVNYFSKLFKRYTGVTPGEFRRIRLKNGAKNSIRLDFKK